MLYETEYSALESTLNSSIVLYEIRGLEFHTVALRKLSKITVLLQFAIITHEKLGTLVNFLDTLTLKVWRLVTFILTQ